MLGVVLDLAYKDLCWSGLDRETSARDLLTFIVYKTNRILEVLRKAED